MRKGRYTEEQIVYALRQVEQGAAASATNSAELNRPEWRQHTGGRREGGPGDGAARFFSVPWIRFLHRVRPMRRDARGLGSGPLGAEACRRWGPDVDIPPAKVAAHLVPGLEVGDRHEGAGAVERAGDNVVRRRSLPDEVADLPIAIRDVGVQPQVQKPEQRPHLRRRITFGFPTRHQGPKPPHHVGVLLDVLGPSRVAHVPHQLLLRKEVRNGVICEGGQQSHQPVLRFTRLYRSLDPLRFLE